MAMQSTHFGPSQTAVLLHKKANCEKLVLNLLMQPIHQKKAYWMLISMPPSKIGFLSVFGRDFHFPSGQENRRFLRK